MKPRRPHPIVAAILAEVDIIRIVLRAMHVPDEDARDVEQEVILTTWQAARHGLVEWRDRAKLRGFLRVVTVRKALRFMQRNPRGEELLEHHEPLAPSAEERLAALETLRTLAGSTDPAWWRIVRAYMNGVSADEIAEREGVPRATIYNRIRLARRDFTAALARERARRR